MVRLLSDAYVHSPTLTLTSPNLATSLFPLCRTIIYLPTYTYLKGVFTYISCRFPSNAGRIDSKEPSFKTARKRGGFTWVGLGFLLFPTKD